MNTIHSESRLKKEHGECIWMQAGVVLKRICEKDYACLECRFNRAMQRAADRNRKLKLQGVPLKGKAGKIVSWKDKLRRLPQTKQPCIHYLKKRIDFRTCTNEYNCVNCEFDQYFYDQHAVHAVLEPVDVIDVEGFKVPQGFYLHFGHTWAKLESGSVVRIGIDDFALRVFGMPEKLKTPLVGKTIQQNRPDIFLSRGEKQAGILSPVSGVVTDINHEFAKNKSRGSDMEPYSNAWVIRVYSETLRHDLKKLMISDETETFFKQEVDRLYEIIEETVPLAADGGRLTHDLVGKIPQLDWKVLARRFLHT